MFEELKKKILKSSLLGSIILILAGLGLAGWNSISAFYAIKGYEDFTKLEPSQIRNQLVEFECMDSWGCYVEATERNTKTNQTRTTALYYVILTGDENSEENYFMSAKVPASYERRMETLTDETLECYYGNGTPITSTVHLAGKIEKLSDEDYSYFQSYMRELGMTDDDIAKNTLPYCVEVFNSQASMSSMYIALFVIGVLLLIWGIVRVAKAASGGSLKKLRKDIETAGYSESMIDSDYRNAKSFDKKGTLKVGRLMTYYISGSDARAIPNNKMMWAYQNTVTHKTNGVKTGTTYNVMVFDEITPKGHTFPVANESISQEMLTLIHNTLPWVVVGYSDELKKLYNKNRSQFLELRYNTCEHTAVEPTSANPSDDSPVGGQP